MKPAKDMTPDEEALPVATQGEPQTDHEQDEVEGVHQRRLSRAPARPGLRSQPTSQPASDSSRSSTPAVNPQTSMSATRNAGADVSAGARTDSRLAGSTNVRDGHPRDGRDLGGSTGRNLTGLAPPRNDRRHDVGAGRDPQLRKRREDFDAGRVEAGLLLRLAQRRADRLRRRPGSTRPPGNAGWPAWLRMSSLRCSSRTSGPSGPSPNRTSTAARRTDASGGNGGCRKPWPPGATRTSASGCNHSGIAMSRRDVKVRRHVALQLAGLVYPPG